MANIDEAFAALSDVQSVSVNENVDFVVDSYLRVISIPVRGVVLGVEGDKDVNRVTFRMSRTYKGVDMSQFQIRINYANANNELNYFKVTEITVSDDEIVFVWVVGADAVAYVGNVEFVVRFIKLSGSNIIQELNTTLATAKSLIGLSVDGEISPVQREDLLAHFYNEIDAYSETKKNEILDSIPEDYTALANEVDELKGDIDIIAKSRNLIDSRRCESGFINYRTGKEEEHKTYVHTDYITIRAGEKYSISNVRNQHFAFYRSDKQYYTGTGENNIVSYNGGETKAIVYFIAPVDGYVRLTVTDLGTVAKAIMIQGEPEDIDANDAKNGIPYYYSVGAVQERVGAVQESVGLKNIAITGLKKVYEHTGIGTEGKLYPSNGNVVHEVKIGEGRYYFSYLNSGRNFTVFYDADGNFLDVFTSIGHYNSVVSVPDHTAMVRFAYENPPVILTEGDYDAYKQSGFLARLPESFDISDALPAALPSALPDALPAALQYDFIEYLNLINPNAVEAGKYVGMDGSVYSNNNYDLTDFIHIDNGKTYYLYKGTAKYTPRTLCYFTKDKASIESAFMDSSSGTSTYIIPPVQDAYYIRITLPAGKAAEMMLTLDDAPSNFTAYGEYVIRKQLLKAVERPEELYAAYSHLGGNALKASAESLSSGTTLTLPQFPLNIKKGESFTFYARFNSFTSIAIGKGFGSYRGDWLEIDGTNIVWKHYESTESTKETKAHGLTISEFLMVAMNVDQDSICHVSLSTLSNTATYAFNWVYEANGEPFVFGGQDMTDVELGAVAGDIDCPVWLFGDSYFGVGSNRIIGQLKNLGYADFCLVDGLAGQGSAGAYRDFERLIALGGTPKILVWCLGMNDSAAGYQTYLTKLKALAKQYGFTLILQKVPVVPPRIEANTGVNAIVTGSGMRYVDAYKAVGADDTGTWLPDYLSSDNIHPSKSGAKAIATRMLIDVPEIMQYGYAPGNIGGGISGDK